MEKLDLRNIPCPRNASKALMFLSTCDTDELIEILLDDGEPIDNVPSSLEIEGHQIVEREFVEQKHWKIIVKAA